jgi:hypothetical protein
MSIRVKDIGCLRSMKVLPWSNETKRDTVVSLSKSSELRTGVKSRIGIVKVTVGSG